ncbi:DNA polymerase III subunit gamma/tau [bacterium]|nr:DNA polymerase III subunit gamma/tau [bacterium]
MLYQRYRPKFFSELVGQDHIKEILLEALRRDRVAHAYLFAGPRGTGKTTAARLLAKALNCLKPRQGEPCGKCENCQAIDEGRFMDLIEIDAASNRGIDNIRELRDKVNLAPSRGKWKVYIIDEVHMLSKEAFNALLKTLEEPPQRVIFILATTEPFAVPPTIISRCQRFDFHPLKAEDVYLTLRKIAQREKIKIQNEALKLIAVYAQGSLRDALSFLDQVASLRAPITEKKGRKSLGILEIRALVRIFDALLKDSASVLKEVKEQFQKGYSARHLINALLQYLEDLIFIQQTGEPLRPYPKEVIKKMAEQAEGLKEKVHPLYQALLEARFQSKDLEVETLPLEVALMRFFEQSNSLNPSAKNPSPAKKKKKPKKNERKSPSASNKSKKSSSSLKKTTPPPLSEEEFKEKWPKVLEKMKRFNHSVAVFLSRAEVKFTGKTVHLWVPFKLYYEVLGEPKNRERLQKILHKIFHQPFHIKLYLAKKSRPTEIVKRIFDLQ